MNWMKNLPGQGRDNSTGGEAMWLSGVHFFLPFRSPGEYTGDRLVDPGTGKFFDKRRIAHILKEAGVPLTGDHIFFCHTGHRASLSWFVSHELLDNPRARMHDGSMAEWVAHPDLPLPVHLSGMGTERIVFDENN